jgi:Mo25-like
MFIGASCLIVHKKSETVDYINDYLGDSLTMFLIVHFMNFRYVLESEHMKKFFDYIQLPNFDIASDASATFKVRFTDKLFERSVHCTVILHIWEQFPMYWYS